MKRLCFCVGSLLAFLLVSVAVASAQEATGDWIGNLDGGFTVRIHIAKVDSTYTGYLTNPSGNQTNLDEVSSKGWHLHFAVTNLSLVYDGEWNPQQAAWVGKLTFQQVYGLSLRRATAAELTPAAHKRPQEEAIAARPPTYDQTNVVFENRPAHIRLSGTLSTPRGIGRFPAIVLVSGTGHNTRDEEVWGHKVFLVLADALTRKGFAVLRYDKRGVGGSTGNFEIATTTDFASDAEAAASWLRTQPNIDAHRVGLLGHSEGGLIAPIVAAADPDISFIVMIAGPALRGDRLFVLQSAMTAKAYGAPDDYIARRRIFDQKLYDSVIAAPSREEALSSAQRVVANGVTEKLVDQHEAGSLAQDVTTPWERYFLSYDPATALSQLRVPVLAIYGSLDVQVPASEDLAAANSALKNNSRATLVMLPGKNHLLQDAKTGAPTEYDAIDETMSPLALNLIVDWTFRCVTEANPSTVGFSHESPKLRITSRNDALSEKRGVWPLSNFPFVAN